MPKVFVHGNPETEAIWTGVVDALAAQGIDDIVLLSPPGFGAPSPEGWDALPASYVEWLAGQLRALDGPVDLVGHDWGAGHVMGLVAAHPDLVRTWAIDCAGLLHPDYVWHDAAQTWQTPDEGEAAIEMMIAISADDRAAAYEGLGLDADTARHMAEAFDAEMGRCILALYRGAMRPALDDLIERFMASPRPPGLVIDATADAYVPSELGRAVADRCGADTLTLTDEGHWWMSSAPGQAASGLIDFWNAQG